LGFAVFDDHDFIHFVFCLLDFCCFYPQRSPNSLPDKGFQKKRAKISLKAFRVSVKFRLPNKRLNFAIWGLKEIAVGLREVYPISYP
jgi:hypothetical protein